MDVWIAEYVEEHDGRYRWTPTLALTSQSVMLSLDIWFETEEACRRWITEHVVGVPLEE